MLLVKKVACQEKLLHDVSDLLLIKALHFRHDLRNISSANQLLDYVEVFGVLEDLEDLLNMWVINFLLSMNFITLKLFEGFLAPIQPV